MVKKTSPSTSLVVLKNHEKNETVLLIAKICDDIRDLLLEKNLSYGNSALEPLRVFSKAPTNEQILVRIDDKLNRIKAKKGSRSNWLFNPFKSLERA